MATEDLITDKSALKPGELVEERGLPSFSSLFNGVRERALYRLAVVGFDNAILFVMSLLLVGSVLAMGGEIRLFQATVILPLVIMAFAIAVRVKRDPANWYASSTFILRDWIPFVLVVFIYENMHDVAGQVMALDIAGPIMKMDIAIFGVEPTLWAQKIYSPLLTDIMAFSYAIYFALPLFIMFLMSLWGKRFEFRHMALALALCFIFGFLGYVFLPCSPPRYFIEHMFDSPVRLSGIFLYDWLQGQWDGLSVVSGGAFPSLHVGISSIALIYAWKYRNMNLKCKILWYAYIPLVTSLWFATVYLRHHWVVDIFAGWFVAVAGYFISSWAMPVWLRLREKYGLPF
ncbi:MAG TPA: phosphatase PAP2 family protein [bacterium]|jgi:membrane-associated phospholipid phosphatase|nr:inositol phosphorylceramide synthase [Myxococcales bacterium]HQG14018.1 phosphatase PAP2 family protein [bacterium]